jgi:NNP family nitrate/nitrite transporter-like MFS transporter
VSTRTAPVPRRLPPERRRPWAPLAEWRPDDPSFWAAIGRRVANRNLVVSVFALFLAFCVWMVWSVVAVKLGSIGFRLTTNQLFWLAAMPGLSGATLRIFYSFMVPIVGGRRWTAITTASLLLPAIGIGLAVQDPSTSYATLLALAALAGLGGGNFASSMTHISFFYPRTRKGTALGLNAGLGNLGVSGVQLVAPLVMGLALPFAGAPQTQALPGGGTGQIWLQNAAFVWVPFVALAAIAAWFGMNDLSVARASFKEQSIIFRRKHTWIVSWLYTGTFGSFIGYSAGLALLAKSEFPEVDATPYAFLGPFVGAAVRPVGGWLADRLGGARVTLATFVVMTLAALGVVAFLPSGGHGGSFAGFLATFVVLFAATGIGNGSVYRMIPAVFSQFHLRLAGATPDEQMWATRNAAKEAGAVVGFVSAVAAYGAFFVPKAFGTSLSLTGNPLAAFYGFAAWYLTCIALAWWYYARPDAEVRC